ncbi:(Fe-S)-binding protein, partial [archaeon]|nr:(Fe-S)-binding protein [archaeon]
NAKEEIKEIVEKCIRCGMCNSHCPVLRIIREEQVSPRGRAIVLDHNIIEKSVYECTLCKACEEKCPLNLKLCDAFVKARQVLVFRGKDIPGNKELIDNLKKSENVFGLKFD